MSRAREVSKIAISLEGVNFSQLILDLEFVNAENIINTILGGAPEALDTLNELSAALDNDPNFYTTIASEYQRIVTYSSSAPENPSVGRLWTDTTDATSPTLKVYNGSEWIEMSGGGSEIRSGRFLLMGS